MSGYGAIPVGAACTARQANLAGRERGGQLLPWQIARVRSYIDGRLPHRVTLADTAQHARLGPSYFSKCFRQSFGVTFSRFVAHERIARALDLMMTSPSNLSQVAVACGFADQAHFTRTFSDIVGETPARWRRLASDGVWVRAVRPVLARAARSPTADAYPTF